MKNNGELLSKPKKILWLKATSDFENVYRSKKVFSNELYVIRFAKSDLLNARFGLSISKKNVKLAVDRNKVKRQLREIIRRISILQNYDYVVSIKKNFLNKTFIYKTEMFITAIKAIK